MYLLYPSKEELKLIKSREAKKRFRLRHPEKGKEYRERNVTEIKKWYELHRDERLKYLREYRKTHPVDRIRINNYLQDYRKENHDNIYIQQKTWVKNNRELANGYSQTYREKHPDKIEEYKQTHFEYMKAYAKAYGIANPDKISKKQRDFRKKQPDLIREIDRRHHSKRRKLGFIPLNNPFPNSHGHHIDYMHVIYIPEKLHRSIDHQQNDIESMKAINEIAFEWIWNHDVPPSIDLRVLITKQ